MEEFEYYERIYGDFTLSQLEAEFDKICAIEEEILRKTMRNFGEDAIFDELERRVEGMRKYLLKRHKMGK